MSHEATPALQLLTLGHTSPPIAESNILSLTSANMGTMNAAYFLASIPLPLMFVYATKPFICGVTSGAIKA